jgi:hypothetical protein
MITSSFFIFPGNFTHSEDTEKEDNTTVRIVEVGYTITPLKIWPLYTKGVAGLCKT